MKTSNLLITIVLACVFYSCGGGKNISPSQQSLIVGKWTLQQEHMVISVNGTTKTDTTVSASANNQGDANFSKSGNFTSAGFAIIGTVGSLSSSPVVETDSTSGVYSIANNQLSLNVPVAGFILGSFVTFGSSGPGKLPVYSLASQTKITQLSQSALILQADFLYTETSPGTGTYETVTVYNFTR
jgi:hypothetical protein